MDGKRGGNGEPLAHTFCVHAPLSLHRALPVYCHAEPTASWRLPPTSRPWRSTWQVPCHHAGRGGEGQVGKRRGFQVEVGGVIEYSWGRGFRAFPSPAFPLSLPPLPPWRTTARRTTHPRSPPSRAPLLPLPLSCTPPLPLRHHALPSFPSPVSAMAIMTARSVTRRSPKCGSWSRSRWRSSGCWEEAAMWGCAEW